MRLFITGFGPFPSVPSNPTQQVVEALRQAYIYDLNLNFAVIDVCYERVAQQIDEITSATIDTLVMLGVAKTADTIRVERCARNHASHPKVDINGLSKSGPVCDTDAVGKVRNTSAPVAELVAALNEAGLRATASQDAGDYLCNYAYYYALREAARRPLPTTVLFVHLPPIGARPEGLDNECWSLKRLTLALEVLIERLGRRTIART